MPPRRRPNAHEAHMDEVYKHEDNKLLWQQLEFLTQQLATLQASNQNPSSTSMENDFDGENPFFALPHRQGKQRIKRSRKDEIMV